MEIETTARAVAMGRSVFGFGNILCGGRGCHKG